MSSSDVIDTDEAKWLVQLARYGLECFKDDHTSDQRTLLMQGLSYEAMTLRLSDIGRRLFEETTRQVKRKGR